MKLKVDLPDHTFLNPEIIQELDTLFQICPPNEIRKSITTVFFSYLANTEPALYKTEIRDIATDLNCLFEFLNLAESHFKK